MKYTLRDLDRQGHIITETDDFNAARIAKQVYRDNHRGLCSLAIFCEDSFGKIAEVDHDGAECALEALTDDVMEPDKQQLDIQARYTASTMVIKWSWRCYQNQAEILIDGNLAQAVKAYCFDLIIMTRNL
jgi:hypothetical protein